ncbi:MAG: hypothetical protein O7H40_16315 [Gammaproteobacteria bacterium]|nr:hypothetical protein [Gammaproteobacteria bacterium]
MSIVELGALGEFFGVFALVATLIYLAIQVRGAKEQSEQVVAQARASATTVAMTALATSNELSAAFCKANDILGVSYGQLDAELISRGIDAQDALRLDVWWTARFASDHTEFEGITNKAKNDTRLVATYGTRLGRLFWDVGPRQWFEGSHSPFGDHVNRLLAEADKQA